MSYFLRLPSPKQLNQLYQNSCIFPALAILALLLPSFAVAQDSRSGGFFPRDFVSRQQLGSERETPTPPPPLIPTRPPLRKKEEGGETMEDSFFGPENTPTPTPISTPEPLVRGTNQRVTAVTGVVAGRSTSEALLLVAEAGRALKERQIPMRELFFFGDPFELAGTMQKAFEPIAKDRELMAGFDWVAEGFQLTSEVPEQYPVTHSPAWIIETADGATVVEGASVPLAQMISPEGELLVPMGGEEIDLKAPKRGPLIGGGAPSAAPKPR
jgi:hypothetical protein